MKKTCCALLLVIAFSNAFSQIDFEKGYFIAGDGEKIDCLIKNKGWADNPTEFEYKLSENDEVKSFDANSIKGFGVSNSIRYVSTTVKIDRSRTQVGKLSMSANPEFEEETLFLKVLVEGKANLYSYEDGKIKRFFYNLDGLPIEQLIFKRYKVNDNKVGENNRFRQQLWNNLSCSSIERKSLQNINYTRSALVQVFVEYNSCAGSKFTTYVDNIERDLFSISMRPRWNSSSLWAKNYLDRSFDFDWGSKNGMGLGIEAEFFLGFRKNKWSLIIEPAYQEYKGQTTSHDHTIPGSVVVAKLKYSSVELAFGIRHYFYLSSTSKLFLNASYIRDFAISDSQLEITRPSGYRLNRLDIGGGNNMAVGFGFKHRAIGIEARYYTKRDPMEKYMAWGAEYTNMSIILSYSIINKKS